MPSDAYMNVSKYMLVGITITILIFQQDRPSHTLSPQSINLLHHQQPCTLRSAHRPSWRQMPVL